MSGKALFGLGKILFATLLLSALVSPQLVFAHAELETSVPADGSSLTNVPEEVHLAFSEHVSLRFSTLQVLDAGGNAVEASALRVTQPEPRRLVLSLPDLEQGIYSVFYKILSETDGHVSRGIVVFGVGVSAPEGGSITSDVSSETSSLEVLFRWALYGSLMVMVGGVAVVALVLDPARKGSEETKRMRRAACRTILIGSACGAVVASMAGIGGLFVQAAALGVPGVGGGLMLSTVGSVVVESRWGMIWLGREIALVMAALGLLFLHRSCAAQHASIATHRAGDASDCTYGVDQDRFISRSRPIMRNTFWLFSALCVLASVAAQSLMGHAAGLAERPGLAMTANAIHILAAGVWIGGIAVLAMGLLPQLRRKERNFSRLVKAGWGPFSLPAAFAVILLFATGLYSAGQEVASVDALAGTLYGQMLLSKILLVLVMGCIGLHNAGALHWKRRRSQVTRLSSWAGSRVERGVKFIPSLVICDLVLLCGVLLTVSIITSVSAPRGQEFLLSTDDFLPGRSQVVDDLVITLSTKPNKPGENVFTVFAASMRRPAPAEIMRVLLRFSSQDREFGRVTTVAKKIEEDRYIVGGSQLATAGLWAIDVVVRRRGQEDTVAEFDWSVPPPGALESTMISKAPIKPVTDRLAIAALAFLIAMILIAGCIWRNNLVKFRFKLSGLKKWLLKAKAVSQNTEISQRASNHDALRKRHLIKVAVVLVAWSLTLAWPDEAAKAQVVDKSLTSAMAERNTSALVPVIINLSSRANLTNLRSLNRRATLRNILSALKDHASLSQSPLMSHLQSIGATDIKRLWIINGVAAKVPAGRIKELGSLQDVSSVRLDATMAAPLPQTGAAVIPEWNIDAIRARELWDLGFEGQGVVVASMDTGVDVDHPDLLERWRGGSNSWFDPYGENATPVDREGHGTQVAGLILGGDAGGSQIGIAPKAEWIAVKIFDDAGEATFSAIHEGFQWLLDPDQNAATDDAPHVVNASFGITSPGECIREFEQDVAVLKLANIAIAVSAGNFGPGPSSSISPANYVDSFAVGAVDSGFIPMTISSRGPSACDSTIFPEVVAPGVNVDTADLSFGGLPLYTTVSGTSFSAAHASGAMALLLSSVNGLAVGDLELAMTTTTLDLTDFGPDNDTGYGMIDVLEAYLWLTNPGGDDFDGDGFVASVDCNDNDSTIFPGAPEVKLDKIDQDCNGYDLTIRVKLAIYKARRDRLIVIATSELGAAAELNLVGYGPMKWSRFLKIWYLRVKQAGGYPGTITISGIEGSEVAKVTQRGFFVARR